MSSALALLVVAALALVAAAGVASGYRRGTPVAIEPPADPLEERRLTLLRSLRDLEDARASGALEPAEYARLRADTDRRLARLMGVVDERRGRRDAAPAAGAGASRPAARVPAWAVGTLLVATVGAVTLAGLTRETDAAPSDPAARTAAEDPFAFFERRVREHPEDLAARLDLARRYLDAGRIEPALAEYTVALELSPSDAEAHAHVGLILFLSDRPEEGLAEVDRALETAPDYPEALLYRGLILLRGLDRPAQAIGALEGYLDSAPFGSQRETAQQLIEEAEAALEGG